MKISKLTKFQNKLTQSQITKLYYKKKNYNSKINFKHIEMFLKKISNIIYQYHITNKKILFIGFPITFDKILKNTQHISIPEHIWFNGMLSTYDLSIICKKEKNKIPLNTFKSRLKLKQRLDLIVIYNLEEKSTATKESYLKRIPVIGFNKEFNILNTTKTTYTSLGNYNLLNDKMENNNFFFTFIESTLNRAKKVSKLKPYTNFKTLKTQLSKVITWKKNDSKNK